MTNKHSIFVAVILAIIAVIALSLFVINSLNPIKINLNTKSLNLPQAKEASVSAPVGNNAWQTPTATTSAQPLFLVLINPTDKLVTTNMQEPLRGQTTSDAKVFLNEQEITIADDGSFNIIAPLKIGPNELVVTAIDQENIEKIETTFVLATPADLGSITIDTFQGIVSEIQGKSVTVTTTKGESKVFNINTFTKIVRKYGADLTTLDIVTGHEVEINAIGADAYAIRDLTNTIRTTSLSGVVTAISSGVLSFTLTTGPVVSIDQKSNSLTTNLKINDNLSLTGLYDERNKTLSLITSVTKM